MDEVKEKLFSTCDGQGTSIIKKDLKLLRTKAAYEYGMLISWIVIHGSLIGPHNMDPLYYKLLVNDGECEEPSQQLIQLPLNSTLKSTLTEVT